MDIDLKYIHTISVFIYMYIYLSKIGQVIVGESVCFLLGLYTTDLPLAKPTCRLNIC